DMKMDNYRNMADFIAKFNLAIQNLDEIPDFIQQDYFMSGLSEKLRVLILTDPNNAISLQTVQLAAMRLDTIAKNKPTPKSGSALQVDAQKKEKKKRYPEPMKKKKETAANAATTAMKS